ncbi:methyl-accepting chemotaxis protein [Altericroceibacterium xinjiangense]|uniref:methyl-accepting chemotaxis protein n=1 Tax=Altericroceibacterium xinjiangense TaxID=762261 RepID=UPI000F7F90E4|nr:methyl-accepting chemotaxis protein [Altericroceibacterium xinjiangense]
MNLSRYTIRTKLLSCLGLFAVAFLALVATLNITAHANGTAYQTLLVDRVQPLRDLKTVADAYAVSIVDAAHKARNGNFTMEEAAQAVAEGKQLIAQRWGAYRETSITGREEELARTAEARMDKADAEVEVLQDILRRGDRDALDQFVVQRLYPAIDPISETMSLLVEEQITIAEQVTGDASASNSLAGTIAILIGLAVLAVWVFALNVSRKSIIQPIASLADTMEALAARKDASIPYTEQSDEIGRMARSCDVFRKAAVDRALAEEENARTQQHVTSALRSAIAAISAGDLTQDLKEDFPAEYEEVRHDFNEALTNLRALIGTVMASAATIRTGSDEIAHASEDLARRTEANAASLEETSAAIAQMDERLGASAKAAGRTVERADGAIATVSGGRTIADEAVLAMTRVSESAKGIDDVIEGLDKIAFQTRVLAMNAAVEAGRAGEAGRGFAVVADLVSALAIRAEEEAGRARDQLTATQAEVGTAVERVQKVDAALADIASDVGEVHALLGQMAADNQAQATAITQISAAVGSMDRSTQQNAAMVEETSAAARNLSGEVEALSDHASQFKVGDADRFGNAKGIRLAPVSSAKPALVGRSAA